MKRCALLWACLFASLTLLTGCISGPDLKGQPFFTPPSEASPDQATVYFYRTAASIGNGVAPTIHVDGKAIGSLPSGGYFKANIPAGKYRVESTSPPIISGMVNKRFDISVENGKVYFIADQISTSAYEDGQSLGEVDDGRYGGTRFYFRYALVPTEQALRSIKWCQKVPATAL
ncbi:DUF2846 domain-containing protein [Pseudomonas sp. H3(2019)]|uniref:DUF2846 domain-containing protein n=1 Tax=Pseudomonas sp. H3(2019) TaxID=2598724 RepID=UPI0011937EC5|nr:DUF2846 domain-containing protein [Pseudomonas sp. H3(2019)]TVT80180.1 DUF2846 domain-containing protein [Pseudomonas sp. H3(2019)]